MNNGMVELEAAEVEHRTRMKKAKKKMEKRI